MLAICGNRGAGQGHQACQDGAPAVRRCVDVPDPQHLYSLAYGGLPAGWDNRFCHQGVGVGDGRVDMRRVKWLLLSFVVLVGSGLITSCSEDTVTSEQDVLSPTTEILYPISTVDERMDIADSVTVYIKADDNEAVAKVEIWIVPESEDDPEMIATLTEPLRRSQIPDTLQQNDGSEVYRTQWLTGSIQNGTVVRLFCRTYDGKGNSSRSDIMIVRIMNEGVPRRPPRPDFTWSPVRGTTESIYTFDASMTEDDVDPPEDILVRWDFDGDGRWDLDWSPTLDAATKVERQYPFARIYTVKLEAKNSYLPNRVGTKERSIEVNNPGQELKPPEPQEMVLVPADAYPVGTADTASVVAGEDEYPLHQAVVTVGFYIRRTEEPNRLYAHFLQEEMARDDTRIRRVGNEIWYSPNRLEPEEPDSMPRRIMDLSKSALQWNPDSLRVVVTPGYEDYPVVGVNWHGAKAYAERYGMRLPTEHEWEIAAKGLFVDYVYPWGTTISPEQANYSHSDNPPRRLLPIDSYPQATSPFGLLNMSGNAREWTKDWYGPYESGQQVNPGGPISGTLRVIRGGSFVSTDAGVRVTGREAAAPDLISSQVGFRTAFTDTLVVR